eukprot:2272456-Rhodomonas_salina.1
MLAGRIEVSPEIQPGELGGVEEDERGEDEGEHAVASGDVHEADGEEPEGGVEHDPPERVPDGAP